MFPFWNINFHWRGSPNSKEFTICEIILGLTIVDQPSDGWEVQLINWISLFEFYEKATLVRGAQSNWKSDFCVPYSYNFICWLIHECAPRLNKNFVRLHQLCRIAQFLHNQKLLYFFYCAHLRHLIFCLCPVWIVSGGYAMCRALTLCRLHKNVVRVACWERSNFLDCARDPRARGRGSLSFLLTCCGGSQLASAESGARWEPRRWENETEIIHPLRPHHKRPNVFSPRSQSEK
jgi:hypothetical protein